MHGRTEWQQAPHRYIMKNIFFTGLQTGHSQPFQPSQRTPRSWQRPGQVVVVKVAAQACTHFTPDYGTLLERLSQPAHAAEQQAGQPLTARSKPPEHSTRQATSQRDHHRQGPCSSQHASHVHMSNKARSAKQCPPTYCWAAHRTAAGLRLGRPAWLWG